MLLFGAGGHAKVVRDCIKASGGEVRLIFDDNASISNLDETPVVKYSAATEAQELLIIAIGDNKIRKIIAEKVTHKFGKSIHPSAIISDYSSIDEGTMIMQVAVVNASTKVGKHCIVNTASVVEHDCVIEDFVHIASNTTVSGGVKIGEGTLVGAGATIVPYIKIGKWCVIGAGSVVTEDIPDYSLVVGVPGKIVKSLVTKI